MLHYDSMYSKHGQIPTPLTFHPYEKSIGSYPDNDITTKAGQKLDMELDRYDIAHDIKIYPGTKHSFFNDTGRAYDAAASEDAWERITRFFGEHLGLAS